MTPVRGTRSSRRIQNKPPEMVHTLDPFKGGKIKKETRACRKNAKEVQIKKKETSKSATTTTTNTASAGSSSSPSPPEIKTHRHNLRKNEKKKNNATATTIIISSPTRDAQVAETKDKIDVPKYDGILIPVKVPLPQKKKESKDHQKQMELETQQKDAKNNNNNKEILKTPTSQFSKLVLMDKDQLPERQKYAKTRVVAQKTPSLKETFPGRLEWKQRHYDKPVTSTPMTSKPQPVKTKQREDSIFGFGFGEPVEELDFYNSVISPIPRKVGNEGTIYKKATIPQAPVLRAEKAAVPQAPVLRVEKATVPQAPILRSEKAPAPARTVCVPEAKPAPIDYHDQFENLLHRYHDEEGDLHVNPDGAKITYSNKTKVFKYDVHDFEPLKLNTSPTKKRTNKAVDVHPKKETKAEKVDPRLEKWLEDMNREFKDVEKVKLVLEKSHSP